MLPYLFSIPICILHSPSVFIEGNGLPHGIIVYRQGKTPEKAAGFSAAVIAIFHFLCGNGLATPQADRFLYIWHFFLTLRTNQKGASLFACPGCRILSCIFSVSQDRLPDHLMTDGAMSGIQQ
jgi:hypothetical protein